MSETEPSANAAAQRTRALNDTFRTSMRGGTVLITAGVIGKGGAFQSRALQLVRAFDAFDLDNDPYGEHDFGAVQVEGIQVFFKIDYYDLSFTAGSPNPADQTVTQ